MISIAKRIVEKHESKPTITAKDSRGGGRNDSGNESDRAQGSTEAFDGTRRKVESGVRALVLKRLKAGSKGNASSGVKQTADQIRRFTGLISANWDSVLNGTPLSDEITLITGKSNPKDSLTDLSALVIAEGLESPADFGKSVILWGAAQARAQKGTDQVDILMAPTDKVLARLGQEAATREVSRLKRDGRMGTRIVGGATLTAPRGSAIVEVAGDTLLVNVERAKKDFGPEWEAKLKAKQQTRTPAIRASLEISGGSPDAIGYVVKRYAGTVVSVEAIDEATGRRAVGLEQDGAVSETAPVEAPETETPAPAKKLRAKLKNNQAGFVNTEILGEVVDYGKTIFRKGMDYLDWSVQMVRDLGDGVRSVLRKVWDAVNGGQLLPSARETGAARVPSSVTPIVRAPATTSQNLSGKRTWDFANPIGNLSRLYKGTADIFNETPGLEFLGRAILQHVDTARSYYGQMTTPFRKWSQRHTAGNRKAALVAFEGYFRENERNKPLANSVYTHANPAGRELIDLWKDAANETGAINQRNNLMVWDGNLQTFRPIGKVGPEYFPRMVKPEVLATLRNPTRNPKGWDALVNEMLAEGIIAKPEDAAAYASTVAESYRSNDHFGAIERARSLPLPSKAYDYSFETARRYLASWSERMAQVEAYGQKVGTEGKDLFDKAQAIAADQPTKDYIKRVQDRAYNVSLDSGIARFAASASTLSTGLQLGNPATTLKNLISGMAFTGQAYGVRRTLGTLLNLKKTFDGINDAYEKGILIDDLMNIMADGEKAVAARPLQTFARVALNVSGFAASEVWVRGVNMVAARAMLRDALKANQKDPLSRRSLQYRGFFARLGLRSPQALLDENGTGPETDKYLRAAVNEVQGGYRFDQVPQFMDTPAGRFLFKYQKWGSQQLRHFARNVANPFVQAVSLGKLGNSEYIRVRDPKTGNVVTRRVPGAVMPMARYLLLLAAAGAATEELLKMLFGIPEKEASWGEVLATLDKDTAAGVGMIATKIWGYHLLVGSMGQLGNYLQMGRDVVARSRFKNPLDPPSVAPLKGVSDLMLDWWEQGTITPDNLDQFSRTQLSMYRVGKQAAARVNDVFGGEFRGLQMETRRQDLQWLNGVSRRYNSQLGVQKNRTQFGRIGKSPQSPFRNGLKQDLLLGDTSGARKRLNVWLGAMPAERRKMELTSLMASVRASQPVKAGYGSEAMRINFLSWSRENLSAADVQRVKAIDSTYRNTARAVGLMKDQTDISESDLDEAMQKIRLKSGR